MSTVLSLPTYVYRIAITLQKAGYDGYIVGGSVRDILQGMQPKDWDITTNAVPEQIQALFPESFYENEFGTVGVPVENGVVEITTYRSESAYSDFRRPDHVEWGHSIEQDLARRDFTINAIALRIKSIDMSALESTVSLGSDDFTLVDPFGGLVDLQMKFIRSVGDPRERLQEDALRMLRAVRFHAQLGFEIDKDLLSAIEEKSSNIERISGERIRDELWKILSTDRPYEGIQLLEKVGLLRYILPELFAGKNLDQRGHHVHDVFTHSLMALKFCPSSDPLVRFAALIHDIGKPETHVLRDGVNTFYNHDIVGSQIARRIADRLRLSKKMREKLYILVRYHMFTVDTIQTDSAVRRFIRKVGIENIGDMIDLRIGDRLGSGTKDAEGWRLKQFKERIEQLLMPTFTVKDLVVDGNDVMRILNIPPSRPVGVILNALFEEVLDDPEKNTKEYLEKRVKEMGA